jgi:hypothetical protein
VMDLEVIETNGCCCKRPVPSNWENATASRMSAWLLRLFLSKIKSQLGR